MRIDIEPLSARDLEALILRAQKRLAALETTRRERIRERIRVLVAREGLTVEEVYGVAPRRLPAARYRNPSAPAVVWSGRGRPPRWFHAALGRGISREEMTVR